MQEQQSESERGGGRREKTGISVTGDYNANLEYPNRTREVGAAGEDLDQYTGGRRDWQEARRAQNFQGSNNKSKHVVL